MFLNEMQQWISPINSLWSKSHSKIDNIHILICVARPQLFTIFAYFWEKGLSTSHHIVYRHVVAILALSIIILLLFVCRIPCKINTIIVSDAVYERYLSVPFFAWDWQWFILMWVCKKYHGSCRAEKMTICHVYGVQHDVRIHCCQLAKQWHEGFVRSLWELRQRWCRCEIFGHGRMGRLNDFDHGFPPNYMSEALLFKAHSTRALHRLGCVFALAARALGTWAVWHDCHSLDDRQLFKAFVLMAMHGIRSLSSYFPCQHGYMRIENHHLFQFEIVWWFAKARPFSIEHDHAYDVMFPL